MQLPSFWQDVTRTQVTQTPHFYKQHCAVHIFLIRHDTQRMQAFTVYYLLPDDVQFCPRNGKSDVCVSVGGVCRDAYVSLMATSYAVVARVSVSLTVNRTLTRVSFSADESISICRMWLELPSNSRFRSSFSRCRSSTCFIRSSYDACDAIVYKFRRTKPVVNRGMLLIPGAHKFGKMKFPEFSGFSRPSE